jgi:ketosteroid isomerase-like protein
VTAEQNEADDRRSRVAAVAAAWEAACRSTDPARIVDLLSPDCVIWYNFDKDRLHDRDAYRAVLEQSLSSFWDREYRDFRVHIHDGGFIEQATLAGMTSNGRVATHFLLAATVAGDRITRIEEYFDTASMSLEAGA